MGDELIKNVHVTLNRDSWFEGSDVWLKWWAHLDLNQGPTGYEPVALTTEL